MLRVLTLSLAFLIFMSCSEDTNNVIEIIGNAKYLSGLTLDSINSDLKIDTIVFSNQFVNGGSSFATLSSSQNSDSISINIGVKNHKGFYNIRGKLNGSGKIPIIIDFKEDAPESLTLQINLENELGQGEIKELVYNRINSKTNGIQINLSWDKANDLDLHLITPTGKQIYYKYPGYVYKENTKGSLDKLKKKYGSAIPIEEKISLIVLDSLGIMLDVDSNPSCDIDGINSENIIIDNIETVQKGTYTIITNLYDQCLNDDYTTNFAVFAKYKGRFIETKKGRNPYIGYKTGIKSDFQEVIQFEIK